MSELWLDIINSDWRGYLGGEPEQDRLLEPAWIEQIIARREIPLVTPLADEAVANLQELRSLMQRIVAAFSAGRTPQEQDVEAINLYLAAVPAILHLVTNGATYHLEDIPFTSDWRWLLRAIAASFATFITQHNPTCIKQCHNPACRWIYYDESRKKNQCWCNDKCANLMRVRRYRSKNRLLITHEAIPIDINQPKNSLRSKCAGQENGLLKSAPTG